MLRVIAHLSKFNDKQLSELTSSYCDDGSGFQFVAQGEDAPKDGFYFYLMVSFSHKGYKKLR